MEIGHDCVVKAQELSLEDDLKRMKRVLRRLGHTDEDNVIQLKGQTASQISTADELVVTELMFNGVFGVQNLCYLQVSY